MSRFAPVMLALITGTTARLPAGVRRLLARFCARTAWMLKLRPARTTLTNLTWCFPERSAYELQQLGLASLTETMQLILESGVTFHWPERRLEQLLIDVQGEEDLRSALNSGRGVLLLVPHFGNWEYLALYLGRFRLVALYDPPKIQTLEMPLKQARERTGTKMLPIAPAGLRSAVRILRQGGLLGVLPDQVPSQQAGVVVPFFGQPALTMTLAHRLIVRHRPAIFIGSASRCRSGFRIKLKQLGEELTREDPVAAVSAMNNAIEDLVAGQPEQYQWEYKRFKSPGTGGADIYESAPD